MNCFRKISLLLVSLLLSVSLRAAGAESAAPVINPTPHVIEMHPQEGTVDVSGGVRVIDRQEAFVHDVDFLVHGDKKSLRLEIDFHPRKAVKAGAKAVSGAYLLNIDEDAISIMGYDGLGAYYGLQTLRQIVEQNPDGQLPCLSINDWPDLPARGVVEGFYGTPWSHQARLSLIDFFGRYKMNTYIYGPKDDPYHSSPYWRDPYPAVEAREISELVRACERNRVDFVWAVHPGQDIQWNEEDYGRLVVKFEAMYDLGVRAFAIFFDDISGEGTDPMRQVELLNRLTAEFVAVKEDVAPLIICPTDYNRSWANPTDSGSLAVYGRELNPSVRVFWTGDAVCSDVTSSTLKWVGDRIQRPALVWWNFPVTDYCRNIVMQGPAYGLDNSLSSKNLCGLVSNPMEHAEASRLALYGVADYAWNIKDYDPLANWERALTMLAGAEARDAYRTFAIHSCDTESGYRREESWETETFRLGEDWTEQQYAALMEDFEEVEKAHARMSEKCRNDALMRELDPWLEEFTKLGERGRRALDLMRMYEAGDNASFWAAYVDNLMDPAERAAYEAHKSGTLKLQPFYEHAMDDMVDGFYRRLAGRGPFSYTAIGSFPNSGTVSGKLMFDDDSTTYYTSAYGQKTGDWIGVDLGIVRGLREVDILQGRNSTDDVDYFDLATLEASKDGRLWYPLIDTIDHQYVIKWQGRGVDARYVRLRKLESDKTNWCAIRTFSVNPRRTQDLDFGVQAPDIVRAVYAFDRDPRSYYTLDGTLSMQIPFGEERRNLRILLLRPHGSIVIQQYSSDGIRLGEMVTDESYLELSLDPRTARVSVEGIADIFEIL